MGYFTIWGLGVAAIRIFEWVNWKYVGFFLLGAIGLVTIGFVIFIAFKYIINPFLKWSFIQMSKIDPPKLPKFPQYKFGRAIERIFRFLFGWVVQIFRTIAQGFAYMIDFFGMVKDLIHSMYKKNCPIITWTDNEEK
jgi:hypothetical protein